MTNDFRATIHLRSGTDAPVTVSISEGGHVIHTGTGSLGDRLPAGIVKAIAALSTELAAVNSGSIVALAGDDTIATGTLRAPAEAEDERNPIFYTLDRGDMTATIRLKNTTHQGRHLPRRPRGDDV